LDVQASVEDLQLPTAVTISPKAPISQALDLMLEREYSQLPVIHTSNKKLVGYVSLASVQAHFQSGVAKPDDLVEKWMYSFSKAASNGAGKYQIITPDTSLVQLGK
jgi:cystathionine beta-synthase